MKTANRILLNGDSCTYFYNPEVWQPEGGPYSAKAIHSLVGTLAEAGVDTFVINGATQRAWYPSRTLPRITEGYHRGDRDHFRAHATCERIPEEKLDGYLDNAVTFLNLYLDLEEAGVDWLAETTVACRSRGMTPWVSVRMNDTHGANSPEGSYFNCPLFRDPAMRINKHAANPADPGTTRRDGLDYRRREVRDYMLDVIRDGVDGYDFDGLELDWMRDPICVVPPASRKDVETITRFFREVKQIVDRRRAHTGRRYPVNLRAPGSLDLLLDIGIDVRTLAHEGLIDCFAPTNFYQSAWDMPYDELRRDLGDNVTLYGVIEGAPNWLECTSSATRPDGSWMDRNLGYRSMSYSRDFIRGNAAGKLVLGADGIEFYNNFFGRDRRVPKEPFYEAIRDVANLETLRGLRKAYTFSTQFRHPQGTIPVERVEQFPCIIEPDTRRSFRFPACAEAEGSTSTVQVVIDRIDPLPDIGISVNGGWPRFDRETSESLLAECRDYDSVAGEKIVVDFDFPTEKLREGWNEITVLNNTHIDIDGATGAGERLARSVRIRSIEIVVAGSLVRRYGGLALLDPAEPGR